MEESRLFLSILVLVFLIFSILGFIKPSIFKQKKRLVAGGVNLLITLILIAVFPADKENNDQVKKEEYEVVTKNENNSKSKSTSQAKESSIEDQFKSEIKYYNKNKNLTLGDLNDSYSGKDNAKKISIGFAAKNNIDPQYYDSFYYCLGDFTRTKNPDLKVDTVLDWCLTNFNVDHEEFKSKQAKYSYFDLKEQFSDWDGSHTNSIEAIKKRMNDPDSFGHLETKYKLINNNDSTELIVITKFKGTNAYGAYMSHYATTTVNPKTGKVLNIEFH